MTRVARAALCAAALGAACATRPPRPLPPPLPRDAYAHYLRGKVALYGQAPRLAVAELRLALGAAPREARIAVALIEALLAAGRPVDAEAEAVKARQAWRDEPRVWMASGAAAQALGKLDAARRDFERAVELGPRIADAHLGLAALWIALDRPDRAEAVWRDLVAIDPSSVEARYRLAQRAIANGNDRAAEPQLKVILELDPDHLDARVELAQVTWRLGRIAAAIAIARQAFDRSGNDFATGEALFWLLCEADDRRGALDVLGVLDGVDLESRLDAVELYLSIGEKARALATTTAAFEHLSDRGAVRVLAARALRAAGKRDLALEIVGGVPSTSPDHAAAVSLAVELLLERGDIAAAAELVAVPPAPSPASREDEQAADTAELVSARARVLRAQGHLDEARRVFSEAVSGAGKHPQAALYQWAAFEADGSDPGRALPLLDRVLARDPNHVAALNLAGFIRAEGGFDLALAEKLLGRARALAPGEPYILDSWGWLLFRRGRLAAASKALARASRLAPHEPEILFHLGETLAAQGRRDDASKVLDRARLLSPPPRLRAKIEARLAALAGGR